MSNSDSKVIDIIDLVKTYHVSEEVQVHALKGVSFAITKGEFVSIMGPSGCGKSTLMNILGFLDSPSSGQYLIDGVDGSNLDDNNKAEIRNLKIGFVFQGFNLLSRTTALENVELPLFYRGGLSSKYMRDKSYEMLRLVGLEGREDHVPSRLSGGQQQRVAIARALVNDPAIILADEPTGNLDTETTNDVMNLFTKLNRELDITIILVTHEPDVADFTKRKLVFKDGLLIEDKKIKQNKNAGYKRDRYK